MTKKDNSPDSETNHINETNTLTENQKELLSKCIKYINHGRLINNESANNSPSTPSSTSPISACPTINSPLVSTPIPNINVNSLLLITIFYSIIIFNRFLMILFLNLKSLAMTIYLKIKMK